MGLYLKLNSVPSLIRGWGNFPWALPRNYAATVSLRWNVTCSNARRSQNVFPSRDGSCGRMVPSRRRRFLHISVLPGAQQPPSCPCRWTFTFPTIHPFTVSLFSADDQRALYERNDRQNGSRCVRARETAFRTYFRATWMRYAGRFDDGRGKPTPPLPGTPHPLTPKCTYSTNIHTRSGVFRQIFRRTSEVGLAGPCTTRVPKWKILCTICGCRL